MRYSTRIWKEAGQRGDERARLVSIVLRKRALSSAGSLAASVERRLALLSMSRPDPWQLSLPLPATSDEDPLEDEEPLAAPCGSGPCGRAARAPLPHGDRRRPPGCAANDERKTRFLLRLLARLGEPVIVFTEYRDTLARLEGRVKAAGHTVSVLHGGMTPAERSRVQQAFNDARRHAARHRRRVGRTQSPPALPRDCSLRAAVESRRGSSSAPDASTDSGRRAGSTSWRSSPRTPPNAWSSRRSSPRLAPRTTTARGRMLDALTESRVAAAVMTNADPARVVVDDGGAATSLAVPAPGDLKLSATREAARLERCRAPCRTLGLAARPVPAGGRSSRPSTVGRRCHTGCSWCSR